MSPRQYGYWLLRWSHDGAIGSLEELKEKQFELSPFARLFCKIPVWAYIELMAVYAASYWFYASNFLHVNAAQSEMKMGLDDGIKGMRLDNGDCLSNFQEQYLRASIGKFFSSILEDNIASTHGDPYVYKADASAVASKFFELTLPLYPEMKSISAADHLLIGHFVSDIPVLLFKTLQKDIGISYVA